MPKRNKILLNLRSLALTFVLSTTLWAAPDSAVVQIAGALRDLSPDARECIVCLAYDRSNSQNEVKGFSLNQRAHRWGPEISKRTGIRFVQSPIEGWPPKGCAEAHIDAEKLLKHYPWERETYQVVVNRKGFKIKTFGGQELDSPQGTRIRSANPCDACASRDKGMQQMAHWTQEVLATTGRSGLRRAFEFFKPIGKASLQFLPSTILGGVIPEHRDMLVDRAIQNRNDIYANIHAYLILGSDILKMAHGDFSDPGVHERMRRYMGWGPYRDLLPAVDGSFKAEMQRRFLRNGFAEQQVTDFNPGRIARQEEQDRKWRNQTESELRERVRKETEKLCK